MLYAMLSPSDGIPNFQIPIPHFDKVVHFGIFCVYAILWALAISSTRWIWIVSATGILLGGATELLQSFVRGRQYDPYDLLADAIGTFFGLVFIYFVKKNE